METIAAGVHQVTGKAVNSFIIDGDEGVTLIDTGLPKRHGKVVDALASLGRSVSDIAAIVITHAHADHTGGASALKRASSAPVFASAGDAPAIGGHDTIPAPPMLDRVPFLKPLFRLMPGPEAVAVDHLLAEGAPSQLPADLTVLDTPGHTPGHVSFLLQRHGGLLLVGDAALAGKGATVKRGWMNRPTPTFDASIRHLAEFDFDIACFGHSGPLRSQAAAAFKRFAESLAG